MTPETVFHPGFASEEQLRLLIGGIEAYAILMLSEDGDVATWNSGATRILGWSAPEIVGHPFATFYLPAEAAAGIPERELEQARAHGRLATEGWRQRKDGTHFWANGVITHLYDATGAMKGFATIIRDRTEYHLNQQALRDSESRLAGIINSAMDGIISVDEALRITMVNTAAEAMFGGVASDLIGQPVSRFLPESFTSVGAQADPSQSPIRSGERNSSKLNDLRGLRTDGTEFPVEASISRIEAGGRQLFTVILRDVTERKKAEAARKEAEAMLRERLELQERLTRIAATAPGVICSFRLRKDGRICFPYASPAIEAIFGFSPESLAADAAAAISYVHEKDLPRLQVAFRDSANRLADWKTEFRVLNPHRGEIWVEGHATPEREPDGSILWHGFVNDITERKRAEEQLRLSEENFRQVVETIQEVFWIHDVERNEMLYVSPGYERIWGRSAKSLYHAPESWLDAVHPGDRTRMEKATLLKSGGGEFDEEYRIVRPDGKIRWIHECAFPIRNAAGKVIRVAGAAEDITHRKAADRNLHLQSAALEAAANAITITNQNGLIEWVNSAFTSLTGYTAGEALGQDPNLLLRSGQQDDAFYEAMWNTIAAGKVWRGELVNQRKDGVCYHEIKTITPVRDEHGNITHFISIKEDITERKKLEAQLLRTQRLESVGRLAGGIAHDLNNSLVPMLMSPPVLRDAIADPQIRELVDTIEAGAKRGADIIRQLLTFSRGASGQRMQIELSTLTNDMVKIARETFPKNIRVEAVTVPGLWLVNADATQLHQILMNLSVNAVDAMPDGGHLKLSLANAEITPEKAAAHHGAKPGPHVVLTVADTGTGIDPEHIDQIFDPFFTTKEVGQGTGLGLSTVLGIVSAHGGFVQVESRINEGTEFVIHLPACKTQENTAEPNSADATPDGKGELILVVDDEDSVRRVTRRLLERHGYSVLEAADGISGAAQFAASPAPIDVVITDLMMPGISGQQLIRILREQTPHARIIAFSGHLSETGLPPDLAAEVQAFIAKPFTSAMLLQTIQRVLHAK